MLGAGLMGSGIAAHLANAGLPVLLLDMLPKGGGGDRNAVAAGAVERMRRADPEPFMTPDAAKLITPGNFEDDLSKLAECDWIIEVVVEDLAAKRALYDRIDAVRRPGSIVSSNTSTIPLASLVKKQSEAFRRDFCVTHFFNPPRYMRLLELVVGPDTRPEVAAELTELRHAGGLTIEQAAPRALAEAGDDRGDVDRLGRCGHGRTRRAMRASGRPRPE